VFCLLPHSHKGTLFHSDPSFNDCQGAKDVIRPLMGLIWYKEQIRGELYSMFELKHSLSTKEFMDWAFTESISGFLNAVHVFLWWYKQKKNK